jgi:hypothetical protein
MVGALRRARAAGVDAFALVKAFAVLESRAELASDEIVARSRRPASPSCRARGLRHRAVTVALMLFNVPGVRSIGVTLMASAGLATLAVGAAAQPALKSLIAGLQMAMTEPIRIGDLVVIDGESGRVEDIRMSYVVIRTGDERRLIVPTGKVSRHDLRELDARGRRHHRLGGAAGQARPRDRPIREAYLARWPRMPTGTSAPARCRWPKSGSARSNSSW